MQVFCTVILAILFINTSSLSAHKQFEKPCVILESCEGGMFNCYDHVLSMVEAWDRGLLSGCTVIFGSDGLYYDQESGPNWWNYFCEPIQLGVQCRRTIALPWVIGMTGYRYTEVHMTRHECADLINKYIFIRPHVQEKIDRFFSEQMLDTFMIGIHYRGTDKWTEAPRVAYEKVVTHLKDKVDELEGTDFKIFIATDEQAFLDYVSDLYPCRVCSYQDSPRSTNGVPVHMNAQFTGYQKGETALIDCLLLSKCDLLIRCSSNLSRWSSYFNPDLPIIEMNQRHAPLVSVQ